jgi:amino acid permease
MIIIDAMVAYSGYLLYGNHIKSNVLVGNFPAKSIAVAIARFGISIAVTVSIPLQLFPARVCLLNLIEAARKHIKSEEPSQSLASYNADPNTPRGPLFWFVTLFCVCLVCLLAYLVDSLGIVYEVVGATAATLMSYILPGLCMCFNPVRFVHFFSDLISLLTDAVAFFPDSIKLLRLGWAYTIYGLALMTVSLYGSISNAIASG